MDDEKILELYWRREQGAIEETERKYGRSCRAVASRILSNAEDVEECVNDAYLGLWNSIPPQRPAHLLAYLLSITRNCCLTRLRSQRAQKRAGGEVQLAYHELAECLPASVQVEGEVEARELGGAIRAFLDTLSRDDRLIFAGRYWLLSPLSDIAGGLGCSQARVKSSLFRSRQKLRQYLMKEGLL